LIDLSIADDYPVGVEGTLGLIFKNQVDILKYVLLQLSINGLQDIIDYRKSGIPVIVKGSFKITFCYRIG
jgi:hypothetical protein